MFIYIMKYIYRIKPDNTYQVFYTGTDECQPQAGGELRTYPYKHFPWQILKF